LYTISFVPDMPRRAQSGRRTSFGRRMWFIESHSLTFYLFIYLFVFEVKVYSYPVKQTKSYSNKRKENNRHFPPEIITLFLVTTSPAPHSYSTTNGSLPTPLSAANRLPCSTISVSNGSPNGS